VGYRAYSFFTQELLDISHHDYIIYVEWGFNDALSSQLHMCFQYQRFEALRIEILRQRIGLED
jgi:hypothetical protein